MFVPSLAWHHWFIENPPKEEQMQYHHQTVIPTYTCIWASRHFYAILSNCNPYIRLTKQFQSMNPLGTFNRRMIAERRHFKHQNSPHPSLEDHKTRPRNQHSAESATNPADQQKRLTSEGVPHKSERQESIHSGAFTGNLLSRIKQLQTITSIFRQFQQ